MKNYEILVTWPESQELMELEGFDENSELINDEDSEPMSYMVNREFLNSVKK